MEQACCSASLTRPGVARAGRQDARPHMRFARSCALPCCRRLSATSSRNAVAAGAYPKVPHAQMMDDRSRIAKVGCLLLTCG